MDPREHDPRNTECSIDRFPMNYPGNFHNGQRSKTEVILIFQCQLISGAEASFTDGTTLRFSQTRNN